MNDSHIMKILNMSEGEVLTLEKAVDRMEFEMLPLITDASACIVDHECSCNGGGSYTTCSPNVLPTKE